MPSCNTYHLIWVSLTLDVGYLCCSSRAQPLLLTLDEGYLLTAALPDLQSGIAPLGSPAPAQPLLLGRGVGPPGRRPWPRPWGVSSQLPLLALEARWLLPAPDPVLGPGWLLSAVPGQSQPGTLGRCPDFGRGVAPLGHAECASCYSRFTILHFFSCRFS